MNGAGTNTASGRASLQADRYFENLALNADQFLKSSLQSPRPIESVARPPAERVRLMAFVWDAETEASLNSSFSHISFPNVAIKRGGIARAVQYVGAERSPETIIVDISGVEMPASRVHDLARLCEPGVKVIAIGDQNDVGLYRDLMLAGANEYIVKPVTARLLAKALSPATDAADEARIKSRLGKLVAVIGARGGVGATTLATHLAEYFANHQYRRVMLVDLDLQTGDCALALNLKPTPGLREALTNPLRIDSLFLERTVAVHGERLFVLSAEEPLRVDPDFTADAVKTLIAVLRTQYHYVIADVPRIPAAPYRYALDTADVRVIVADQTLRSVRDTVRLRDTGDRLALRSDLLVLNRVGESGRRAITLEEMAKVKLRPDFVIPFRPKLFTTPGVAPRGPFRQVISALAAEISGRAPEPRGWRRFVR